MERGLLTEIVLSFTLATPFVSSLQLVTTEYSRLDAAIDDLGTSIDKAKQVLLDKGGLGRLVMNLTGSGGSGKSFVLDATKSFCKQFVRLLGNHSMILFL